MRQSQQVFETARDRGDDCMLICMKRQENAEPLIVYRSGDRHDMLMTQAEFCSTSPFTGGGWGFAFVGLFNTAEPWEGHAEYLRGLDFKW